MNKDLLQKKVNKNRRGFKAFGVYGEINCLKCENEKWGCSAHHQCPECVTHYRSVYQ